MPEPKKSPSLADSYKAAHEAKRSYDDALLELMHDVEARRLQGMETQDLFPPYRAGIARSTEWTRTPFARDVYPSAFPEQLAKAARGDIPGTRVTQEDIGQMGELLRRPGETTSVMKVPDLRDYRRGGK